MVNLFLLCDVSGNGVEITPDVYFQEPEGNEKDLVRVERKGSESLVNHQRLSSPSIITSVKEAQAANVDRVETIETAEFPGNMNSDEEISQKRHVSRISDSDENSDDGKSSELSKNGKTSLHVLGSDSGDEPEVERGSEQDNRVIPENSSISEKSAEGSEGKDVSNTSSEIDQQLRSSEISSEEIQEGNAQIDGEAMMETDEVPRNAEQSDSEADEEISRKRPSRRVVDSDESSDDEHGSERSRNGKTSHHVSESDPEDESEVDGGSEQHIEEIRENSSICEKSVEGSEGKEVSNTSSEIDGQSKKLEAAREEIQAKNVHTVEEEKMDSDSDEEISRRRPSRNVIEIDDSSDDEHEISGNNRKRAQSRRVIESSDAEDQIEVTAEEIHENIPNYEKNENQVEDTSTRASPQILDVNSDSEKSDSDSEIERISMNAKASSEKLSESEGEVFSTPKSSTSSWNVPERTSNSEKERGSESQSLSKISENDPGIQT